MPNLNELLTLADYGRLDPAIDPVFNNGVDSFTRSDYMYWSSTTYQNDPLSAWGVHFVVGSVSQDYKNGLFYVRAVRGGF